MKEKSPRIANCPLLAPPKDPKKDGPVEVEVRYEIHGLSDINTQHGLVKLHVFLETFWVDDRIRLDEDGNIDDDRLRDEDGNLDTKNRLWRPKLAIVNAHSDIEEDIKDPFMHPLKQDDKSGIHVMHSWINLTCQLSFTSIIKNFPFDSCSIPIIVDANHAGQSIDQIILKPLRKFCEPTDMDYCIEFVQETFDPRKDIQDWKFINATFHTQHKKVGRVFSQTVGTFNFQRQSFYYTSKLISLIVLSTTLSFISVFIDVENDFQDRISYVVTMFIVISAYMFVAGNELPKTTYLTCLDKIVISSHFSIFLICMETTLLKILILNAIDISHLKTVDYIAMGCLVVIYISAITFIILQAKVGNTLNGEEETNSEMEPENDPKNAINVRAPKQKFSIEYSANP